MQCSVIEKMIDYFQTDVRRINHALKVYDFAQLIAQKQPLDDQTTQIISYTAILHDIGIKEAERKYHSTAGNYQELEGPPIAEQILSQLKLPEALIKRVCYIIGHHHSYAKIAGLDFQIIVEADLLVNIYEDQLDRPAIENINKRLFKTTAGKWLLQTMYLNHPV